MSNTPLTPQQIQEAQQRALHEDYFQRVIGAFDVFWDVVTDGLPDETISSRVERHHSLLARVLNHICDAFQTSHGQMAQAGDLARAKQTMETEVQALTQETGQAPPIPKETP